MNPEKCSKNACQEIICHLCAKHLARCNIIENNQQKLCSTFHKNIWLFNEYIKTIIDWNFDKILILISVFVFSINLATKQNSNVSIIAAIMTLISASFPYYIKIINMYYIRASTNNKDIYHQSAEFLTDEAQFLLETAGKPTIFYTPSS